MRIRRGGFIFSAPVLFSVFFLLALSSVKAQTDMGAAGAPDAQANTLSAAATGVSELPEVVVHGRGIDQAAAFDQMHESLNKVNILSQSQINQTPAKSVAQAAEQLPGVGTQHDTSEPRYISIRGTDSNFDIITFNGTIIPSYDEAARSVELDSIPAGLFGEMQLYKTILPDMDAQGIGGQLNLVPKSALNYPSGFFEIKAEGEFFPERNQPGTLGNLSWGQEMDMGGEAKLGILVDAGYQYSRFGIDDLENDFSDQTLPPLVANSVNDYQFRYYNMERDRAGIGTNIDLSIDKNDKLYANLMYAGYDEYRAPVWNTTYENIDATAADGAVVNPDGSITIPDVTVPGVDVTKSMSDELQQFRNLATALGGENKINGFDLDYQANFSYANEDTPWNYGYKFENDNLAGSLTYNNSTNNGNNPTFNFSGLNGTDTNPANFVLSKNPKNSTSQYQVAQYGGKADGKFDIPLGGADTSTVKFGTAARLQYSTYTNASYSAAMNSPLTMTTVLGPTYTYYDGLYSTGPLPGFTQTTDLLNNPNPYVGSYRQTDPIGDQGGDYNNWEDVYAGYAMYTVKSGPMELMSGARLEVTHIQYTWYQVNPFLANGDPDTSTELSAPITHIGDIDYADVMPSLGFKYSFNPNLVTRANYSQTIARPTQNQYIPAFSLGQANSASTNSQNFQEIFGNPNLKPIISNNVDFSCEFYPQKGAILAADFFLKDIQNYIEQNYDKYYGPGGAGSGGVTDSINYVNIPTADIYGAEFQYQQQYTSLPGLLSGLGFRGSISFMGSQGELAQGIYGELPSQSDLIWDTGIFFKKGGFTFDVGGNFTGKNLNVVGDPKSANAPNIYADDYFQVNAKAQYAFTKDFRVYADGNNLNNAHLRYYQASPQYPIQNEQYQPSFDGGIDVSF